MIVELYQMKQELPQVSLTNNLQHNDRVCTCAGVYLFLKGEALQNNSFLIPDDDNILVNFPVCHTDKLNCCNRSNEGGWSLPTNTMQNVVNKFTVIRNNQGTIQLMYGDTSYSPPQGIYCCMVPDADNIDQTVCVNTG